MNDRPAHLKLIALVGRLFVHQRDPALYQAMVIRFVRCSMTRSADLVVNNPVAMAGGAGENPHHPKRFFSRPSAPTHPLSGFPIRSARWAID